MRVISFLTLVACLGNLSSGMVSCPPVFSDNMVLQHGIPVAIWGHAEPGENVRVSFGEQVAECTTGDSGEWRVFLSPLQASADPGELVISGINTLLFRNVVVGEVWLCSGQSNMEKPIGEKGGQQPTENHLEEIVRANYPDIRLLKVPKHGISEERMRWEPCSPVSVEETEFSAVGYFFGVEILRNLEAPIGLIDSSFGGTMIEAWMPESSFLGNPDLEPLLDRKYFAWVDGVQATELYLSMIAPLCPYSLKGFLWYQGESNVMDGDSAIYSNKLRALISGWRKAWGNPIAPFYFVQIAPFNYSDWTSFPKRQTRLSLPAFWEAQAAVMNDPHTGMVVTMDLAGDAKDIHPVRKKEVGQRLARLALADTYGMRGVTYRSPEFTRGEPSGDGRYVLNFQHTGDGLQSSDGLPLTHFQVAGRNGVFHPADATIIDSERIAVSSEAVPDPVAARFAWEETARPNLVNSEGLPAVPFRTDSWPVQTIQPQ